MDGWLRRGVDGWMDGWLGRGMGGWMDGWLGGGMDGWMDGWVGGWMDEWLGGGMDECVSRVIIFLCRWGSCDGPMPSLKKSYKNFNQASKSRKSDTGKDG